MVIERELPDLTNWPILRAVFADWFTLLLILSLVGLAIAVLRETLVNLQASSLDSGPMGRLLAIPGAFVRGLFQTLRSAGICLVELFTLPLGLRRLWAIARLSVQESIRRRVLYVLILFLIPFLFAGWYLPKAEEGQLLYYVGFTYTAMGWLLLPMVLFVVAMSFPSDIKSKTIQTIVTKPVRLLELVLGRVLGFMMVFTVIILFMGGVSLAFIYSQVSERTLTDQWVARVPIYSSSPADMPEVPSFFFVKQGVVSLSATNVGREWSYRSHIEGDKPDEARWLFHFDPSLFSSMEKTTVGLTFDVFKTTKGNPTREDDPSSGVWCSMDFVDIKNVENKFERVFRVNNNRMTQIEIPASVLSSGELAVRAQCLTRNQFLGMAKHDLYLEAAEQPFEWNFAKGLWSLWLKVLFLTSVAVAGSTVLNGFVTIVLTIGIYVLGLFHDFLREVAAGQVLGGGPIESGIRMVGQMNQTTEIDPGFFKRVAKGLDPFILQVLDVVASIIPNLSTLETVEYVASGFNIPAWLMLRNTLLVVGYVLPVLVVGYILFRNREAAA